MADLKYTGSVVPLEVAEVIANLGGEARAVEITEEILRRRGGVIPTEYGSHDIFHKTINQVIQYRCSRYDKFRFPEEEYFEYVSRARYRLTTAGSSFLARSGYRESSERHPSDGSQASAGSSSEPIDAIVNENDASASVEGRERYRIHRERERDPRIAPRVKAKRLSSAGALRCDVCDFDFEKTYGERGRGFIEAHHTMPLSDLTHETVTRDEDIALVCSNCHRILHRGKPAMSVQEMRRLLF
jgi:hypothetical protein